MLSLLYFLLASLVSAAATEFNCGNGDHNKTEDACIATKWCVWNAANPDSPYCMKDSCLKYIANLDNADEQCSTTDQCKLFYITDIHDCSDGTIINQTDLFCRLNNPVYKKQPIDECFYQDLKNRATTDDHAPKCSNLDGGIACAAVGSGANSYCDSTGEQTCSGYYDDNDLAGLCNCLKPERCNLYPGCAAQKSGSACIADPCASATVGTGGSCVGNIAGIETCEVVNVMEVKNNQLVSKSYCVSNDQSKVVKKNDYNPCFYGVSQNVTYPGWNVNQTSDCQTVTEQNKCSDIQTTTCESVEIAAGWFSSAQGHYCTDGKNRNVPSPSAAMALHMPSVLCLLAFAIALLL